MRVRDSTPVRFRCHTGHAYTSIALEDELREKIENATWSAVRALQEHAMLLQELTRQRAFSHEEIADYGARSEMALKRAQMLRASLVLPEANEHNPAQPKS